MGQKLGLPVSAANVVFFANLPREALESLWESYNLLGEGWGLNLPDFISIIQHSTFLTDRMGITDDHATVLFEAFDTDHNGLIDALELIVTLCVASGMDTLDKLFFAFSLYDFESAGALGKEAINLLLLSIIQGWSKLCGSMQRITVDRGLVEEVCIYPTYSEIESMTGLFFEAYSLGNVKGGRITILEFQRFCCIHPVVSSWLRYMALVNSTDVTTREHINNFSCLTHSNIILSRHRIPRTLHTPITAASTKLASKKSLSSSNAVSTRVSELPWKDTIAKMQVELPTDMYLRTDLPEDAIEPLWVHGHTADSMQNAVRYSTTGDIVYSVANLVVATMKPPVSEDPSGSGDWKQARWNKHRSMISCLEVDSKRTKCATADTCSSLPTDLDEASPSTSTVVLWDLKTGQIIGVIPLLHATGVLSLDFSHDGSLLLVMCSDVEGSIYIYDTNTLMVIFNTRTSPVIAGITTAASGVCGRMCGSSSVFCVGNTVNSTHTSCMDFYVEEDSSYMNPCPAGSAALASFNLNNYVRRAGLFAVCEVTCAKGVSTTAITKFEQPDECISGNEKGHVVYWRGRNAVQCLNLQHDNQPITSLHYAPECKSLVAGSASGKIALLTICPKTGNSHRGLQIKCLFGVSTSIPPADVLSSVVIRSVCLWKDASKVLVSVVSGEVMELNCIADEAGSLLTNGNSPADGDEGSGDSTAVRVGDSLHDKPVVRSHWSKTFTPPGKGMGLMTEPCCITAVCKGTGGYYSCGSDGMVCRWAEGDVTATSHCCILSTTLDSGCCTMTINASRTLLAVALDGKYNATRIGQVAILNADTLNTVESIFALVGGEDCSPKNVIPTCIQFSPDGKSLVIATGGYDEPPIVTVYVPRKGGIGWTAKGTITAFSDPESAIPASPVTAMDWTSDGAYLRMSTAGTGGSTFFICDAELTSFGNIVTSADDLRSMQSWATNTCPVQWDARSVWTGLSVMPSVDGSSGCGITVGERCGNVFLLGMTTGELIIARVPTFESTVKGGGAATCLDYRRSFIHPGGVSSLCILDGGAKVVTAGTADGTVRVWSLIHDADEAEGDEEELERRRVADSIGEDGLPIPPPEDEEDDIPEGGVVPIYEDSEDDEDLVDGEDMVFKYMIGQKKPVVEVVTVGNGDIVLNDDEDDDVSVVAPSTNSDPVDGNISANGSIKSGGDASADGSAAGSVAEDGSAAEEVEVPPPVDLRKEAHAMAVDTRREDIKISMKSLTPWIEKSIGIPLNDVIVANANQGKALTHTPKDELSVHWVYGYSCRTTRAAVRYSKQGKIMYPAGSMAIMQNKALKSQSYYMGHHTGAGDSTTGITVSSGGTVTCLDVHVASGFAVSVESAGSVDGSVIACVWDSDTGVTIRRLDCGAVNAASAVAFSPDGNFIAVACQDFAHTIMVFDWKNNCVHARINGGRKKILCLSFSLAPGEEPVKGANTVTCPVLRLLQGGINHFQVTDIREAHLPLVKQGHYGPDAKHKLTILCCAALPMSKSGPQNEFVVGMSNGNLGIMARGDRSIAYAPIQPEKCPITAVYVAKLKNAIPGIGDDVGTPPVYQVITGGTQGHIKVLDMEFNPVNEYNIYAESSILRASCGLYNAGGQAKGIKALCVDKQNRKILYGTAGGEIAELHLASGEDVNEGPVVQCHYAGNTMAMDTHPTRQECVTVGDDKTLRLWNMETLAQFDMLTLPDIARCVCFSQNGHYLAVGLGADDLRSDRRQCPREYDGKVVVISYMQNVLNIVHQTQDCDLPITCIMFTPDSATLLAASMDGNVYVYDAMSSFAKVSTLAGDGSLYTTIRFMDISNDSMVMAVQGVSKEGEEALTVWDLTTRRRFSQEENRAILLETQWKHRRASLGNDSIGIFPAYAESSRFVTCSARSHDHRLMCTGDQTGTLKMFTYPSNLPHAPFKRYGSSAHCAVSGGVAQVCFSAQDQYLLSLGKSDKVLVQWKIHKNEDVADVAPEAVVFRRTKPNATKNKSAAMIEAGEIQDTTDNFNPVAFTVNGHTIAKKKDEDVEKNNDPFAKLRLLHVMGVTQPMIDAELPLAPSAFYAGTGDVVTFAGGQIYAMDKSHDVYQQHHMLGQDVDDIGAYTISQVVISDDGKMIFVADNKNMGNYLTGLPAPNSTLSKQMFIGRVRCLEASTGRLISVVEDAVSGGVANIAHSRCNKYLACVGLDEHHSLYIYRSCNGTWKDSVRTFCGQVDRETISLVSFIFQSTSSSIASQPTTTGSRPATATKERQPVAPPGFTTTTSNEAYQLITGGGKSGLRFWHLHGGSKLSIAIPAEYGEYVEPTINAITKEEERLVFPTVTTAASIGINQVVTGDNIGTLYFWNGHRCVNKVEGHKAPITCLIRQAWSAGTGGYGFITGSTDNTIKFWTSAGECSRTVDISSYLQQVSTMWSDNKGDGKSSNPEPSTVHCMSVDANMKRMVLTTASAVNTNVMEISLDSGATLLLAESIIGENLHMIASPVDPTVMITASITGCIQLWNIALRKCVETQVLKNARITAVQFCPKGDYLAVGFSRFEVTEGTNAKGESAASVAVMRLTSAEQTEKGASRLTITHKICNLGSTDITFLRYSENHTKLAVLTNTSIIHIFNVGDICKEYTPGGVLYSPSVQVGLDFSSCSRYLRSFGSCRGGLYGSNAEVDSSAAPIDLHFYDFDTPSEFKVALAAKELVDAEDMEQMGRAYACAKGDNTGAISWATVSSIYTSDSQSAIGLGGKTSANSFVTDGTAWGKSSFASTVYCYSVSVNVHRTRLLAGYSDGTIRLFKFPCFEEVYLSENEANEAYFTCTSTSCGPVEVAFTADGEHVLSMGINDGCVRVWSVDAVDPNMS